MQTGPWTTLTSIPSTVTVALPTPVIVSPTTTLVSASPTSATTLVINSTTTSVRSAPASSAYPYVPTYDQLHKLGGSARPQHWPEAKNGTAVIEGYYAGYDAAWAVGHDDQSATLEECMGEDFNGTITKPNTKPLCDAACRFDPLCRYLCDEDYWSYVKGYVTGQYDGCTKGLGGKKWGAGRDKVHAFTNKASSSQSIGAVALGLTVGIAGVAFLM
ncbi:hypothetical protein LTS18_001223 [Coniosporium uncinatum]|uniref:Uncharacterized protein n=1 Tax=Coniosporium uncinatum TaxID=93489 RepID=A0ACC3DV03_9PEZI|nr:hypothetical protein LTS18_001223 [Coniosporium uncinatum]